MGLIIGGVSAHDLILDGQSVSLYAGGNPPVKVWPTRETVQITLGTGYEARDQLRATLADRGLSYETVTEIPFDIELVGTGSTNAMFSYCYSLTSVPAMDTSQVTNMAYMFSYCTSLVSVPAMDTSQVTDMSHIFEYCKSLTSAPAMDTSQVTSMNSMFYGCSALTSVPDLDTSQVTDMEYMFGDCPLLTTVPAMDTSRVTNMSFMFYSCTSLTYVPDMATSRVTDMYAMFQGCSSLTNGNVRLIGRHRNVDTTDMIRGSGLTRMPFYNTNGYPI